MEIRIHITLPQWTQWVVCGVVAGVILGVGGSRVYADTLNVKTSWQAGEKLTSADLNTNFANLKAAIEQIKNPDCPVDYTRDATVTAFVLCKKDVDEVVKVGTGGSGFWIDRYEASTWLKADGTGTQYGISGATDYPSGFPGNGQYTTPVYALSKPGVRPAARTSWFQAQQACRLSGKRLPTGEEWLTAATGTVDPGASDGSGGDCVTSASDRRTTGTGTKCVSRWGAQDMIGSLWEWTIEWWAGLGEGTWHTWPDSSYNGDTIANINSWAYAPTESWQQGLPAAAGRGGDFVHGTESGIFAMQINPAPSFGNDGAFGFRCVVTR